PRFMMASGAMRAVLFLAGAIGLCGQDTSFARPGLIHYVEGRVVFGNETISPKPAEFFRMEHGDTLTTETGRAEVLLTPGVFVRIGENSSFKLTSDTAIELLAGVALVEVAELGKDAPIVIRIAGSEANLSKRGLYRLDVSPPEVRIYEGDASGSL